MKGETGTETKIDKRDKSVWLELANSAASPAGPGTTVVTYTAGFSALLSSAIPRLARESQRRSISHYTSMTMLEQTNQSHSVSLNQSRSTRQVM